MSKLGDKQVFLPVCYYYDPHKINTKPTMSCLFSVGNFIIVALCLTFTLRISHGSNWMC